MAKGGKIIRPDGSVANGRKKLVDPKVQTTCYFLKSAIEKLGKEQCRLIAEQAVNRDFLKKLFQNNSDCYADTWSQDGLGAPMVEGEVIQAMTVEQFIKVVKSIWQ